MGTGAYTLITALNVNGINASTERHRLAEWIQKTVALRSPMGTGQNV